MDLSDAQRFAREQLDKIPPTKYEVSPQQAYQQAGEPHGPIRWAGAIKCRNCNEDCVAYSQAGAGEVSISRMCEPCFDFTMQHPDDRTPTEQRWMSLVKYTEAI